MKKSTKNKDFDYICYDENDNLLCQYKYKHVELKFIIDFSSDTANVLDVISKLPISRNLSFKLKDKLIKKLSKNDINLNVDSYLKNIENNIIIK